MGATLHGRGKGHFGHFESHNFAQNGQKNLNQIFPEPTHGALSNGI